MFYIPEVLHDAPGNLPVRMHSIQQFTCNRYEIGKLISYITQPQSKRWSKICVIIKDVRSKEEIFIRDPYTIT